MKNSSQNHSKKEQIIKTPYKLVTREWQSENTIIPIGQFLMGNKKIGVIAGPCAVESREQIIETAHIVKEAGAIALRGGAYKARTSPYSFRGYGEKALHWLIEAKEATGLPIVTEVLDTDSLPLICEYADILQVGTRNMQNFSLLEKLAKCQKPILLKRGMYSTLEEFLLAAEYLVYGGNAQVILCERGIRTFTQHNRNTFDVGIIPVLKAESHLPVIADPSHAVGDWRYITAIARSAIAVGADGLLIEVHPDPEYALSDGQQSLKPKVFQQLMKEISRIAEAIDRSI